jgi:lincosamide nucleotidyltransferase A/C/D/E
LALGATLGERRLAAGQIQTAASLPLSDRAYGIALLLHYARVVSREPTFEGMRVDEVVAVLADLRAARCEVWTSGGWGVDALVGRQTRAHRDLDLAVDAEDEATVVRVLGRRGYRVETDWRPIRVEFVASGRGWVDMHPVAFDGDGHGRQADHGDGHFDYPPDAFGMGVLAGVAVPCLSRQQQVRFHRGYKPREVDLHDLRLLEQLSR